MDPIIIAMPGWMSYLILVMCVVETISVANHVYDTFMDWRAGR